MNSPSTPQWTYTQDNGSDGLVRTPVSAQPDLFYLTGDPELLLPLSRSEPRDVMHEPEGSAEEVVKVF